MTESLKIQRNKRKSKGRIKRKSLKRKNKKIYKGGTGEEGDTEQEQSNKIYPPPPIQINRLPSYSDEVSPKIIWSEANGYKRYSESGDNSGIICYYFNSTDLRVWINENNDWIKSDSCSGNCRIEEKGNLDQSCVCKVYQVKYYTYYYYPNNQKAQRPVYFNSWIGPDENIPSTSYGFLNKGLMPKPIDTASQTPKPQFVWYLTYKKKILERIPISEVSNS